jgi:hypothetical protein
VVGAVRDYDGELVSGGTVFVRPENRETTHTDAHAETEPDGSYQTGGLETGTYVVSCKMPGSSVENLWLFGVAVVDAETTVVDLDLSSGGSVAGTVRDLDGEPVSGAVVFVRSEDREGTYTDAHAETEPDGSYQTGGLQTGTYVVSCKMPGPSVEHPWLSGVVVTEGEVTVVDLPAKPLLLLHVHPNERGPGPTAVNRMSGLDYWSWPSIASGSTYTWKQYDFAGSANLWIQVCAQNFSAYQNAQNGSLTQADLLKLLVDGIVLVDVWGLQSGALGSWQWQGWSEKGKRITLEFFVTGLTPGAHKLVLQAQMSPIIYWVKVYDLENPGPIE